MQGRQPMQRHALPQGHSNAQGWSNNHDGIHPFTRQEENTALYSYEQQVKGAFARIETTLKGVSAAQHDMEFIARAQHLVKAELGFELPEHLLADSWVKSLDMGKLYAWCVFETFQRMSRVFFNEKPLASDNEADFQTYIETCGFHTVDISPCADGRLAHVIRYVLRLPYKNVRRKSHAGATFDVEDSLQKWVETEMLRHREAKPNAADAPTRYLKMAVYHHSSSKPATEGCAAHGSDTQVAANAALERLQDFKQSVENSFCCGASIDLLLIGIDTDNDVIRMHLPNAQGNIDATQYLDAAALYDATRISSNSGARTRNSPDAAIKAYIESYCQANNVTLPAKGMVELAAYMLSANISQIDYVRQYHAGCYQDIGHQECFIGMGIGFEEVQLRNLTYFAYLQTVEEGAKDLDVGIKIFTGLNASRGLPIPVVIRHDYHGQVPGAKARAEARCHQLDTALRNRFSDYVERGLLHTLLMVRDCHADSAAEAIGSSLDNHRQDAH